MNEQRLQKLLASAGIASRRDCEALIAAGRVSVNGRVVREAGLRVDMTRDSITVDGKTVALPDQYTYIMLNKPVGVVSTVDDPQGRTTVVDLIKSSTRLFPVGRLDVDSEGLLLLTNDGELTHHLTHPRFEVEKEYRVLLDRMPDNDALETWRKGKVVLDGKPTAPAQITVLEQDEAGIWIKVVLREGRKRHIREVARSLGYTVLRLIRVREDTLSLEDLPPGEWRALRPDEIARLRAHITRNSSTPQPKPQTEQAERKNSNRKAGPTKPSPNRAWRERQEQEKRLRQQRSGGMRRSSTQRSYDRSRPGGTGSASSRPSTPNRRKPSES